MVEVLSSDLLLKDWEGLNKEFEKLEDTHKQYQSTAASFIKLQTSSLKDVAHQKKRLKQLAQNIKRVEGKEGENKEVLKELKEKLDKRTEELETLEDSLPRKNDLYLRIILDGINVSFVDQEQRFNFKEQYEKFKLIVSGLILFVAILDLIFKYRAIDAVLHFLLVWYHCTLTIRESILIVNGSRIKGWWRSVQFIRTVKAGIFIVWPDGVMYDLFRTQFVTYHCYTTFLQFLQFNYQRNCLYRLRTLGERFPMDLTIQGFHSWMWKGLTFLIPFLYGGYIFQFHNAYTLFQLSQRPECDEWQVIVSALIFLILAVGNSYTTSLVVYQKFREKWNNRDKKD